MNYINYYSQFPILKQQKYNEGHFIHEMYHCRNKAFLVDFG